MPRAANKHNDDTLTRHRLAERFQQIRLDSIAICAPLATEDYCIQTVPEVSPPKWHLAHTSWFFEAFILIPLQAGYRPYHPDYDYLFNSYYETHGTPFPRAQRGLLSRPGVAEVLAYREYVDLAMHSLIEGCDELQWTQLQTLVELGLNHEQQHQELLYTDIKHILAFNPLQPVYQTLPAAPDIKPEAMQWQAIAGGIHHIGHDPQQGGFAYDNEGPRHRVLLRDFHIAQRPVNNAEYLQFMQAGGYRDSSLWLADGWKHSQQQGWDSPLYWQYRQEQWWQMTLAGPRPVDLAAPVTHISFYEADAFARWHGCRLPDEAEWEVAASSHDSQLGNYRESGYLQPVAMDGEQPFFGNVWQWTQSAYRPYPGFVPLAGSIGEYNGKFMCNQMVLRGGSCVSPRQHLRHSYRNFFYPHERWQFTGIRLAKD